MVVFHDQESSDTPEFPVRLGGSQSAVGVRADQCVACTFLLLWAISVDCSEGTRAPGVRCCISDEEIHLWKKSQQNVTLVLLKCCLGCVADSKRIILREMVKEHCYKFTVQQSQTIILFCTNFYLLSLALSCPENKQVVH